jgi:hypothetical protein
VKVNLAIFVGPSLFGCAIEKRPQELWLPPVRCGDVVAVVAQHHPKKILIIDGFFHQVLSVWHKEIIYALLKGIVVIGASSMGALRAAELWRYGMLGVGKIFQMFRDGEEDDSLVALTCNPETYEPMTEAPVGNRQKTLDALEALAFARSYKGKVKTTLTKESIRFPLSVVMTRFMDDHIGE